MPHVPTSPGPNSAGPIASCLPPSSTAMFAWFPSVVESVKQVPYQAIADATWKAGEDAASEYPSRARAKSDLSDPYRRRRSSGEQSRGRGRRPEGRRLCRHDCAYASICVGRANRASCRSESVATAVQNIPVEEIKENTWKAGQAAAGGARFSLRASCCAH